MNAYPDDDDQIVEWNGIQWSSISRYHISLLARALETANSLRVRKQHAKLFIYSGVSLTFLLDRYCASGVCVHLIVLQHRS